MKMLEFDRVVSSDPIDRTASVVTGPSEHWDPERPQLRRLDQLNGGAGDAD